MDERMLPATSSARNFDPWFSNEMVFYDTACDGQAYIAATSSTRIEILVS
jgi:hypothetical protein